MIEIERRDLGKPIVFDVKYDEEQSVTFTLRPMIASDYFFIAESPDYKNVFEWIAREKLISIEGVQFSDGTDFTKSDLAYLPSNVLFDLVTQYVEAIKAKASPADNEKKSEGSE